MERTGSPSGADHLVRDDVAHHADRNPACGSRWNEARPEQAHERALGYPRLDSGKPRCLCATRTTCQPSQEPSRIYRENLISRWHKDFDAQFDAFMKRERVLSASSKFCLVQPSHGIVGGGLIIAVRRDDSLTVAFRAVNVDLIDVTN